ncbi:hypothetical protein B0H11DRAFT_2188592 [Mycena galericulata]|nr:hypothetical protein B0H11DRAFT_2188592 [Mycena galericulata]
MTTALLSFQSLYSSWFTGIFLQALLYGIGVLQIRVYIHSARRPEDDWTVKLAVQLIASYLSVFTVQSSYVRMIYRLTEHQFKLRKYGTGIVVIVLVALVQLGASISQTIIVYRLRSYLEVREYKVAPCIQTAASLLCDVCITGYLWVFLARETGDTEAKQSAKSVVNSIIAVAVTRAIPTALSSIFTMIFFLAFPETFWFILPLGLSSKFYLNSMLATLNTRDYIRNKMTAPMTPSASSLELDTSSP